MQQEAFGVADGETVTVQSDGQVTHPHYSEGGRGAERHVDGWEVTNNSGNYNGGKDARVLRILDSEPLHKDSACWLPRSLAMEPGDQVLSCYS